MAKPGGNPGRPTGPGDYSQRTVSKAKPSPNAWKPVISKEHGPGVRTGNTFKSIAGRVSNLNAGTRGKSTRESINNFNKRFKNK